MSCDDLPALLAELDADPIYHLSLNSKEPFHSNLLAWFGTHFSAEAAEVFGPWSGQSQDGHQGREIGERETGHVDLVLRLPGLAPIAIENKVWSLPEDRQLARYATGPLKGPDHASLVLLSFTPPGWPSATHCSVAGSWRYRSYA